MKPSIIQLICLESNSVSQPRCPYKTSLSLRKPHGELYADYWPTYLNYHMRKLEAYAVVELDQHYPTFSFRLSNLPTRAGLEGPRSVSELWAPSKCRYSGGARSSFLHRLCSLLRRYCMVRYSSRNDPSAFVVYILDFAAIRIMMAPTATSTTSNVLTNAHDVRRIQAYAATWYRQFWL